MLKITKIELQQQVNDLTDQLLTKEIARAANEQSLIRVQSDFDIYRARYAPVSKQMITRWFRKAIGGTTEQTLLREYMTVLLEVMERYGD